MKIEDINPIIESKTFQHKPKNNMSLKIIRKITISLCIVIISGGIGWWIGTNNIRNLQDFFNAGKNITSSKQTINRTQPGNQNADMKLFWDVWDKLEKEYLFKDKINYQEMVYGAISGMTAALGDPYTAFYPPKQNQTSKENLNGSFEGVGIQLGYKKEQVVVIAPISGMPAEKAGVRAGDYILRIIDEKAGVDKETYNLNLNEVVELIRGEGGTAVKLTLLHEGDNEPYEATIVRDTIIVPSVEVEFGKVIDNNFITDEKAIATSSAKLVARLKLSRFGELTDQQWDESIDKILKQQDQLQGIVLDVRNNPGGLMQGAVNLAAEFLPAGDVVVKQENSNLPDEVFKTKRIGRILNMPLVVLVNKGSASASEILAGALRDNNRAKIVGEKSFGKGTIQQAQDLDTQGAGIHITIARWLTPNGEWVHDKGLTPDYEVIFDPKNPLIDNQMVKAVEVLGKQ